jgi:hypothetical protein
MPRPQYCCPQVYPAKQAMPPQPHDLSLNGMRHYDVDVCSRSVRASETVEFKPIRTYLKQEGTRFHTLKNVRFSLFVCRLILKMHCVRSSHAMTNIIARIAWNVRSVATILYLTRFARMLCTVRLQTVQRGDKPDDPPDLSIIHELGGGHGGRGSRGGSTTSNLYHDGDPQKTFWAFGRGYEPVQCFQAVEFADHLRHSTLTQMPLAEGNKCGLSMWKLLPRPVLQPVHRS